MCRDGPVPALLNSGVPERAAPEHPGSERTSGRDGDRLPVLRVALAAGRNGHGWGSWSVARAPPRPWGLAWAPGRDNASASRRSRGSRAPGLAGRMSARRDVPRGGSRGRCVRAGSRGVRDPGRGRRPAGAAWELGLREPTPVRLRVVGRGRGAGRRLGGAQDGPRGRGRVPAHSATDASLGLGWSSRPRTPGLGSRNPQLPRRDAAARGCGVRGARGARGRQCLEVRPSRCRRRDLPGAARPGR